MKDEIVYVEHILTCIERIETYTGGNKSNFFGSTLVQDAVVRDLEVMAESTQRSSDEIKSKHPDVDWRGLAGFRNVLAHGYLGLDTRRIWDLIETRLTALKSGMERLRAELIAARPQAGQ